MSKFLIPTKKNKYFEYDDTKIYYYVQGESCYFTKCYKIRYGLKEYYMKIEDINNDYDTYMIDCHLLTNHYLNIINQETHIFDSIEKVKKYLLKLESKWHKKRLKEMKLKNKNHINFHNNFHNKETEKILNIK